jgi:hypothetical protein
MAAPPSLETRFAPGLAALSAEGVARDFAFVAMPGNAFPWTDTRIEVSAGDCVTLLAEGEVANLGLTGGARFLLWRRIVPDGEVAKGTQDATSFRAERSGRLELAICHGEWSNPSGDTETPREVYGVATGALDVLVVRWAEATDASTGIDALHARLADEPLVVAERERLASPPPRPDDWQYLWFLGESDTFTRTGSSGPIACHTRDDVAILRREVDLATPPDTQLHWRWKIDALPSSKPEDELLQHDYLSVAVEWDCGRDITYLWSCGLPVGRVFTCPIPQWAPRETHVVVRSGPDGLGQWHAEARDVERDYREILGSEPGRIVAVWLIAVSLFQHGEGSAEFDALALHSGGRTIDV